MLRRYLRGRVIVFIDAANLEISLKNLGWHMDYKKLFNYFYNYSKLIRITYYSVRFDNERHNDFLTVLKKSGYKLVTKNVKTIFNGINNINKANFDVEITLDARNLMEQYDSLVLFSGDSDFEYLVKFLRDKKKKVIVVSSRHHISKELIGCCNKYIDIRKLESVFKRMDDIK